MIGNKKTLRIALLKRFVLSALLPFLFIGGFIYQYLINQGYRDMVLGDQLIANTVKTHFQMELQKAVTLLDVIRIEVERTSSSRDHAMELFRRISSFQSIFFLNHDGVVDDAFLNEKGASLVRDLIGMDFSRQINLDILENEGAYWSNTFYSFEDADLSISLIQPYSGGYLVGTISLSFFYEKLSYLNDILDEKGKKYAFIILDGNHYMIYDSGSKDVVVRSNYSDIVECSEGEESTYEGLFDFDFGGQGCLGSIFSFEETGWHLIVYSDLKYVFWMRAKVMMIFSFGLILSVLIGYVIAFFLARGISDPLDRMREQAKMISGGSFAKMPCVEDPYEEIEDLSLAFSKMMEDIRLREDALARSRERYQNLFDSGNDCIFLLRLDVDGFSRVCQINKNVTRHLGYDKHSFSSIPFEDIMTEESALCWSESVSLLRNGVPAILEIPLKSNSGDRTPYEIKVRQIYDEGKSYLLAAARNISKRKEAERLLIEAKEAAERASQAKSDFLAIMSHEMRTPLNPIMGFTDMLLDTCQDKEERSCLNVIHDSAAHLLSLIEDVLNFSKMQKGDLSIEEDQIDLYVFMDMMSAMAKTLPNKHQVELIYGDAIRQREDRKPFFLFFDRRYLKQILFNLLSNACKFTPPDGVVRLEVDLLDEGDRLFLAIGVRDEGIGISENSLDRIFEPFSQLDSSLAREYEGMGLGLAMCRKIVDAMDGRLGVESQLGEGSLFWVHYPVRKA